MPDGSAFEVIDALKVLESLVLSSRTGHPDADAAFAAIAKLRRMQEAQSNRYGLVWPDKPEKFEFDLKAAWPVLSRVGELGQGGGNTTGNMLIEGDNYHALACLQYTHKESIELIYIDPPYNTESKDFRYNDCIVDPEDDFKHSKWLSSIEKRLKLAWNLLKPSGVIVISIDDHELAQLKMLCDQIFDERRYHGMITWHKRTKSTNSGKAKFQLQQNVEYCLVYSRNFKRDFTGFKLREEGSRSYPHSLDGHPCRFENLLATDHGRKKRDTMKFSILGVSPPAGRRWQVGKEEADRLVASGRIALRDSEVKRVVFPGDEPEDIERPFWSHLKSEQTGSAETGKALLSLIVGPDHGFDTVKPLGLMQEIISHFPDDITVLDFYAGSGTTGHAVLNLNATDGGSRRFILCTNNENKICEDVTIPRLRAVINGYEPKVVRKDGEAKEPVDALGGRLTQYRTSFVPHVGLSRAEASKRMSVACRELVWIKEGVSDGERSTVLLGSVDCCRSGNKAVFVSWKVMTNLELAAITNAASEMPDAELILYAHSRQPSGIGMRDEDLANAIGRPIRVSTIPHDIIALYEAVGRN